MAQDFRQQVAATAGGCKRVGDRRSGWVCSPPPYQSIDGLILHDRRSYRDRRATWVRDFSIATEISG